MKKIIILFVFFFAVQLQTFGQSAVETRKQALKIYEPKLASVSPAYNEFQKTTQVSFESFSREQLRYVTKKRLSFRLKADAVCYEIEGNEKYVQRYFRWAEQQLSEAEAIRASGITFTAQQDKLITFHCLYCFYYDIVSYLYANLDE